MGQSDIKQAAGFVFAGAVAGAAIALLYASQSGNRTQKDIRQFAGRSVDRLDDLQGEIRSKVSEWVAGMAEIVKDGVDRGRRLGTEGYEQALQGFDNAKRCVEDGRTRLEQLIKTA
jgi:gas vesicle protein